MSSGRRRGRGRDRDGPRGANGKSGEADAAVAAPRVHKELGDLRSKNRYDNPGYARGPVNRASETPMLVRILTNDGTHHTPEEVSIAYVGGKRQAIPGETLMYLWRDDTLLGMYKLLRAMRPRHYQRIECVAIAHVYQDRDGNTVVRELGRVDLSTPGKLDGYTLEDLSYLSGDAFDLAINPLPGVGERPAVEPAGADAAGAGDGPDAGASGAASAGEGPAAAAEAEDAGSGSAMGGGLDE
jgi:hypothetical protein